jgi:hypothetical protein
MSLGLCGTSWRQGPNGLPRPGAPVDCLPSARAIPAGPVRLRAAHPPTTDLAFPEPPSTPSTPGAFAPTCSSPRPTCCTQGLVAPVDPVLTTRTSSPIVPGSRDVFSASHRASPTANFRSSWHAHRRRGVGVVSATSCVQVGRVSIIELIRRLIEGVVLFEVVCRCIDRRPPGTRAHTHSAR